MNQHTYTSGTNKGNRRIWIEGNRLAAIGATKGNTFSRTMQADGTMRLQIGSTHKGHRIAGNVERPIIDLCGQWVTRFMGSAVTFSATFTKGAILIAPNVRTERSTA
jgi:hypothetical protein